MSFITLHESDSNYYILLFNHFKLMSDYLFIHSKLRRKRAHRGLHSKLYNLFTIKNQEKMNLYPRFSLLQ